MTITVESLTEQSASMPQPVPLKAHLSFSAINQMARCGKQFQLERVLGLPESPGYAALAGRAVHAATEAYDRMLFTELGR